MPWTIIRPATQNCCHQSASRGNCASLCGLRSAIYHPRFKAIYRCCCYDIISDDEPDQASSDNFMQGYESEKSIFSEVDAAEYDWSDSGDVVAVPLCAPAFEEIGLDFERETVRVHDPFNPQSTPMIDQCATSTTKLASSWKTPLRRSLWNR
ncbi:hypothetical protein RvY_00274-1 [Ramazzottius varieornatus]|uniref:Uncharacterized protein n=1 Tax=Ramazzottius varieornatus TaxID=947166 RepID=A0A1D1UCP8_RAMVA|nr:hypothetical protein RvY_00274-1 [Ramazzottius varieornatus]